MVAQDSVLVKLHCDSDTIYFIDSGTESDFYIDCSGVSDSKESGASINEDTKVDLCQHFLLNHLHRNWRDCRSLSRLLGDNNMDIFLSHAINLHLGDSLDNVEGGLRSLYKMLGRLISTLEQREVARQRLLDAKEEQQT